MNKVWSGYIEWEGWANSANAYILPPGCRTIWAADEWWTADELDDWDDFAEAEPFFLSFPHLMFLCVLDAKKIYCNFLPSAKFTTKTLLYPSPFNNTGSNGFVCLGNTDSITFANDNELIDYFFSSPFEPKEIPELKFKNKTISTLREWAEESKKDPNFGTSIQLDFASNAAWRLEELIIHRPKFVVGQRVYYPVPGTTDKQVGTISSCWHNTHLSVSSRHYYHYYIKNHGFFEDQLTEVPE